MPMKTVELVLSPALYPFRTTPPGHVTVVVDVLRATSSICAAFMAGAEEVVPLDSLDPLPDYREKGYTLAAERNAHKVMGAECGNSPCEYLTMDLHGRRLAYSTTNGTVGLLLAAQDSKAVFPGCFGNLSALAHRLHNLPDNLVVLCSGWKSGISLEDTLFAGALIQRLHSHEPANDACHIAIEAWTNAKEDLYAYCQRGTHIHRLRQMNYDNDVRFVLKPDTCPVVPIMSPITKTITIHEDITTL